MNFHSGQRTCKGIAHRGTFDLTQHTKFSGKDLSVFDQETGTSETPVVVESSVAVLNVCFLTLLFDAYHEDVMDNEHVSFKNFIQKLLLSKLQFYHL